MGNISSDMNATNTLFLDALKHALKNQETDWEFELDSEQWCELFRLASIHNVLPLFMQSVYQNSSLSRFEALRKQMIRKACRISLQQAHKTAAFTELYQDMLQEKLKPIVMKGIICRNLYANPEQRPSVDEDLLIFPYQIDKYHQFLTEHGFRLADPDTIIEKADEISYQNESSRLYLEVHKYLFPQNATAYGNLNGLFSVLENLLSENIYGTDFRTFGHTDHLLYMICHAYKHFLYSGIGIRQICDISLYTEKYEKDIDWEKIYEACAIFRIDRFMIAIMNICEKHLGLDAASFSYKKIWSGEEVDEGALLDDILSGGLYGTADENRTHSSTMTLEVVSAQKEGRKPKSLVKTVFPSEAYMQTKYAYVKKNRWLLPLAWTQRGYDYLKNRSQKKTSPAKTIEIGNNRIGLLRKYNIID